MTSLALKWRLYYYSYYEDISEDESIFDFLAEEQMEVEQLSLVDEDANDGGTSEAETVAYQDDSVSMMCDSDDNTRSVMRDSDDKTSMMRDSPFQDGDHSDDVIVTSQDTLRDNSAPAVLVYSEILDEGHYNRY